MRAIGVTRFGGPEALQVLDLAPEELGPGQVRVRVTAATVNPTDTLVRSGARATGDTPPDGVAVPGMDIAGVLTEIGPDADTALAVGEHVMGIVRPSGAHGGYREDLVLPARSVTRIPSGSDDAAASTLPMNGLTSRLALDV
ncbi:MAG: alcohol dehydrogenase catalytic domain-containing protein, partial [Actinobacteria bacterium]|nr:alcohol dehydrogenase catalytic domain-containing protein [Actinomycetota bacterium]